MTDTTDRVLMLDPALVFVVDGVPAPQGSKTVRPGWLPRVGARITIDDLARIRRSMRVTESSDKVKPWRAAVTAAAVTAMAGRAPATDPVAVHIDFHMPRPSDARTWQLWCAKYPDVDKLTRSTFDGLKTGGVVADDSLIVSTAVAKRYVPHTVGRRDPDPPGATISVYVLGALERDAVDLQWQPIAIPGRPL